MTLRDLMRERVLSIFGDKARLLSHLGSFVSIADHRHEGDPETRVTVHALRLPAPPPPDPGEADFRDRRERFLIDAMTRRMGRVGLVQDNAVALEDGDREWLGFTRGKKADGYPGDPFVVRPS